MIKQVISFGSILLALLSCTEAQPLNSTQNNPTLFSAGSLQRSTTSVCRTLTTRELEHKVSSLGGYNKRYLAATKADTAKFPKLISHQVIARIPALSPRMASRSRGKRQTTNSSYPQTNLTSVARRGSLDQDGYQRLCTEWSAVTTLSSDHFPRFLNEVICDAKDAGCLSYEGICVQESFVVDILRNTGKCGSDGKYIWEVVSQPIRSCCNCRLFQGSFLGKYV